MTREEGLQWDCGLGRNKIQEWWQESKKTGKSCYQLFFYALSNETSLKKIEQSLKLPYFSCLFVIRKIRTCQIINKQGILNIVQSFSK